MIQNTIINAALQQLETIDIYKMNCGDIPLFFKTKKLNYSRGVLTTLNFLRSKSFISIDDLLFADNVLYLANKRILNYSNNSFGFIFSYYQTIILPKKRSFIPEWVGKLRSEEVKSSALLSELKSDFFMIDLGGFSEEYKKSDIEFERDVYALLSRILL